MSYHDNNILDSNIDFRSNVPRAQQTRCDAKAHLYLGRIYLAEKRHDDAVAEFQKASELQPDLLAARRGLREARAAAAKGSYGGCGCLSVGGGGPRLASMAFPAVAILVPHLVRLALRRRQRM